jgi:NAD+ diphosphatase
VRFVGSSNAPQGAEEPSWWFFFSGQKIVVEAGPDKISLPLIHRPSTLGLNPLRAIYLGALDGVPCRIGEIAPGTELPEGMSLVGLRHLFGAMNEDLFRVAGRAFQTLEFERHHQYCGRCGGPTEDKENERAKICPRCGLVVFPRMSPAMIVAVRKGRQILLARAARFPEGLYSVLAGFVEPGESLEQCVQREVREEAGVEVRSIRYFGSQPWPFPNSLMVAFTAEYGGGEIRIDGAEIVDAGWFAADNLPAIPDKISIARRLIDAFVKDSKK